VVEDGFAVGILKWTLKNWYRLKILEIRVIDSYPCKLDDCPKLAKVSLVLRLRRARVRTLYSLACIR
jgi:hypothetical protein